MTTRLHQKISAEKLRHGEKEKKEENASRETPLPKKAKLEADGINAKKTQNTNSPKEGGISKKPKSNCEVLPGIPNGNQSLMLLPSSSTPSVMPAGTVVMNTGGAPMIGQNPLLPHVILFSRQPKQKSSDNLLIVNQVPAINPKLNASTPKLEKNQLNNSNDNLKVLNMGDINKVRIPPLNKQNPLNQSKDSPDLSLNKKGQSETCTSSSQTPKVNKDKPDSVDLSADCIVVKLLDGREVKVPKSVAGDDPEKFNRVKEISEKFLSTTEICGKQDTSPKFIRDKYDTTGMKILRGEIHQIMDTVDKFKDESELWRNNYFLLKEKFEALQKEQMELVENQKMGLCKAVHSVLSRVFSESQIKKLTSKGMTRIHWSQRDMQVAVQLENISREAYDFLQNNLKYPLPTSSSIIKYKEIMKARSSKSKKDSTNKNYGEGIVPAQKRKYSKV